MTAIGVYLGIGLLIAVGLVVSLRPRGTLEWRGAGALALVAMTLWPALVVALSFFALLYGVATRAYTPDS
jgi:hypothetical protein